MSDAAAWIPRLEAELARELGQAVSASAGGEAPAEARSLIEILAMPGTRVVVAADRDDLARLLAEGRVIEAGQADEETVRELWTGLLGSVAARLGGSLGSRPEGGSVAFPSQAFVLRLGEASVRMALAVEIRERVEDGGGKVPASAAVPGVRRDGQAAGRYDLLLEIELETTLRFGSRSMDLRDLLELGPGDVVELDRQVSDPVDLIVGDKIVARGEVVLVEGNFGLRVTEVAAPIERLESIRCSG